MPLTGSKVSLSHSQCSHKSSCNHNFRHKLLLHAKTLQNSNSWTPRNETCQRKGGCVYPQMKLVAEILTGSLFYVEVGEDANVGDLKKEIGDQENLPTDRLILVLDNTAKLPLLQDEVSLKDYGVQDGSHIYIFFKPLDHDPPTCPPQAPQDPVPNEPSTSMDVSKEPTDESDDKPSTSVDSS